MIYLSLKKGVTAFIIISILGVLWHFVFEWSGQNTVLKFFFPINESIWEHLKLLFYPTLIFSAVDYLLQKEKTQNYIPATVIALLFGMVFIVVTHYVYYGIIGRNIDFINILLYFISVAVMLIKKAKIIKSEKYSYKFFNSFFISVTLIIALLFAVFSVNPPPLGIFMPPFVP